MTGILPSDSETAFAQRLLSQRRDREKLLGTELASDPAWTMLVTLFVAFEQAEPVALTRLCAETGTPPATALRWLEVLASNGNVGWSATSRADLASVNLTPETADQLRALFGSWIAQGG